MIAKTPFAIERSPLLEHVPHGFFGSSGDVHQFGYGGPGDTEGIRSTRQVAASAILPGASLQAPHQVHSPDVITISKSAGEVWSDDPTGRPIADAVVTDRKDIVIGIVTADCAPVLFADRNTGVVGAAHAGWRGANGGVLENTVAAMEALGAERPSIIAVVGPTIAQPSYEVDGKFRANFREDDSRHFAPAPIREGRARWHFDLPGYVLARLREADVGHVSVLNRDTYAEWRMYYSYRRATQRKTPDYGRQLSAIAL